MDEESLELRIKDYKKCLHQDYIHVHGYDSYRRKANPVKVRINHMRAIIELLVENPGKLWEEDFLYEVEEYERKKFGEHVTTKKLRDMKKAVKKMRKESPELVEKLCEYYKNNILTKNENLVIVS